MTNAVRVFCIIVDITIPTAAVVGTIRAHRRGMARVRKERSTS